VRVLERLGASEEQVQKFVELVKISEWYPRSDGTVEELDRLFLDNCKNFNFAKPFDTEDKKAYFRPNVLPVKCSDHHADMQRWGDDFDPKHEQSYRRGYDQGFDEARRMALENLDLEERQKTIHAWRFAQVWFGASRPGTVEPFDLRISFRSSLPAKLRWTILERDGRRCVVCGASAADGVSLHVDHIVSIYNGGTNDPENLQTLCAPCNLGKGKH
jgi:hypothetical protein